MKYKTRKEDTILVNVVDNSNSTPKLSTTAKCCGMTMEGRERWNATILVIQVSLVRGWAFSNQVRLVAKAAVMHGRAYVSANHLAQLIQPCRCLF